MPGLRALSDGVVVIRPFEPIDVEALVDGRDDVFHRFLGDGEPEPRPVACIVVDDTLAGWVDYDAERPWLEAGEVNIGYNVFAPFRGHGYASRAVKLLMRHLAADTQWRTATLLVDPDNERSLALARRLGFTWWGDLDQQVRWKRDVAAFRLYGQSVATP